MAENMEKGFKQIAELLNQDGVMESLKGILGGLGDSSSGKDNDQAADKNDEKSEQKSDEKALSKTSNDDMGFVLNIARAMSEYKNANDPSTNLLSAISPFLNEKRQKACVNCVRVLKMAKVYDYMKKHGEDFAL